jgi:hypothetical protein
MGTAKSGIPGWKVNKTYVNSCVMTLTASAPTNSQLVAIDTQGIIHRLGLQKIFYYNKAFLFNKLEMPKEIQYNEDEKRNHFTVTYPSKN